MAFSKASMKLDKRKVCFDFCRFHRLTLKGCSPCSSHFIRESDNERKTEQKKEQESGEREYPILRPAVAPPRIPLPFAPSRIQPVASPNAQRFDFNFQATTDATTPDWNRMCTTLCRNGSGGLLCNCDLPPF